MAKVRRVAVLGSTGSIGRQALQVIDERPELAACALAAGSNGRLLAEQARRCRPDAVALADPTGAEALARALPPGTGLLTGPEAMVQLVRRARPDVLLTGVVGSAGLAPTLAGIECGCRLAIANKETLVMAGAIVMPRARAAGVDVLPVDSEHSAIFQCLAAGRRDEVRRVVITASGGALRQWSDADAENAAVAHALDHPTWQMGPKVTIDSATMMNKALEVIEAHWLFGLSAEQIQVVLHPESIVHSFVEFCDGSVMAQLARPDMTMPIAYALCYPDRPDRAVEALDVPSLGTLTFRPLAGRFARAIDLAYAVIRRAGLAGAVLNGANEAAVEAYLDGRIPFGRIVALVAETLNRAAGADEVTLENLLAADAWARRQVTDELAAAGASAPAAEEEG